MVAHSEMAQRIARLTPLSDALVILDGLAQPIAPVRVCACDTHGLTLAADAIASAPRPFGTIAFRDGWAVRAEDIADAGSYAPVPLSRPPIWCGIGFALPGGTDTVAPLDAISWHGTSAEAVATVTPGEGVLTSGADVTAGTLLRPAGARLRASDVAALARAGIDPVPVRIPRIRIVNVHTPDPILDAIVALVRSAVAAEGGVACLDSDAEPEIDAEVVDRALRNDDADAVIVVGGTGSGPYDDSVRTLARVGEVAVHGIAIAPGETAAFGRVEDRPVLLVPGRIDSALAVWLLVGRSLLARLRGGIVEEASFEATLSRKIASRLGFAEIVLVRRDGDAVTPLASEYLPIAALAQAEGWLLVPADSEGFPAGSPVTVRPLP